MHGWLSVRPDRVHTLGQYEGTYWESAGTPTALFGHGYCDESLLAAATILRCLETYRDISIRTGGCPVSSSCYSKCWIQSVEVCRGVHLRLQFHSPLCKIE